MPHSHPIVATAVRHEKSERGSDRADSKAAPADWSTSRPQSQEWSDFRPRSPKRPPENPERQRRPPESREGQQRARSKGSSPGRVVPSEALVTSLVKSFEQDLENTRSWVGDWLDRHRRLYVEHVEQQEQLLVKLMDARCRSLDTLRRDLSLPPRETRERKEGEAHKGKDSAQFSLGWAWSQVPTQESKLLAHLAPVEQDDDVSSLFDEPPATGAGECRGAVVHGAAHGLTESHHTAASNEETEGSVHRVQTQTKPKNVGRTASAQEIHCKIESELKELHKCDHVLNLWKRTSGLQTVLSWVSEYNRHPGGWPALLMIHGVPEVTGRLRNKVENYAIYSALFLSMSITLLADKPEFITTCEEHQEEHKWWTCHIQLRIYFYGLMVGVSCHLLSIALAMAFLNALNEAARDADVYRMFARGNAFAATVKCQNAFRFGCVADLVSVLISVTYHIGWEAFAVGFLLTFVSVWQMRKRGSPLFETASIQRYWRPEKGGRPDPDDPYDLEVPVGIFQECAAANKRFFLAPQAQEPNATSDIFGQRSDGALWMKLRRTLRASAGIKPMTPPSPGALTPPGATNTTPGLAKKAMSFVA